MNEGDREFEGRKVRRRRYLEHSGAIAGVVLGAGCQFLSGDPTTETKTTRGATPTETATPTATPTPPPTDSDDEASINPFSADRLVGAHYYPWYQTPNQDWTYNTPLEPVLGEYASNDPAVVEQHIRWCLEHGIQWLSISWWGPDSTTATILNETIVEVGPFDRIQFSILYETLGRLGEFGDRGFDIDDPSARDRLRADLVYLEDTYFEKDNYLHFDERPVIFFYISHRLLGDVEAAFEEATAPLDKEPYILAEVPFDTSPGTYPISIVADGVTSYNPYVPRDNIEEIFHDRYAHGSAGMQLGAEAEDLEYVPVVAPGFNNTADSRKGALPVLSPSPGRYERVCDQVGPHLSKSEAVLITSFNEWYEATSIEPHEAHGTNYLQVTRDRLATGSYPVYETADPLLKFDFNKSIVPAEVGESTDVRPLSFMADRVDLFEGDERVRTYNVGTPGEEPVYPKGAHGAVTKSGTSRRWFGGHEAVTTLLVEMPPPDVDSGVLRGQPMRSHEIEADVYYDGTLTDHLEFGRRGGFEDHSFSLTPGRDS